MLNKIPIESTKMASSFGRGGNSSGSTLDNRRRGPEFDYRWDLYFFSSLSYLLISGASLIMSLVEMQHYWFLTFQEKEKMET